MKVIIASVEKVNLINSVKMINLVEHLNSRKWMTFCSDSNSRTISARSIYKK